MADPFYILFRNGPPDDWCRAAGVLDKASPTLARGDATRACRFGHGLVPVPLPEAEAVEVAGALDRAGFPTVLLPFKSVIHAPAPFMLSNADAYPDAFHIQVDATGRMQSLPWVAIRMLLIACVKPRGPLASNLSASTAPRVRPENWAQERRVTPSPLMQGMNALGEALMANAYGYWSGDLGHYRVGTYGTPHLPEAAPPAPRKPEVWMELFVLKPLMRLRIQQDAFNYDYLAERLTTSSRKNFASMLRDILQFAPDAAKVGQIGPALVGLPMDHPRRTVDEQDHENSVTALLTRESIIGLPR